MSTAERLRAKKNKHNLFPRISELILALIMMMNVDINLLCDTLSILFNNLYYYFNIQE